RHRAGDHDESGKRTWGLRSWNTSRPMGGESAADRGAGRLGFFPAPPALRRGATRQGGSHPAWEGGEAGPPPIARGPHPRLGAGAAFPPREGAVRRAAAREAAARAAAGIPRGAAGGAERLRTAPVLEAVASAARERYAALGGGPVAVGSSATAEDLPGASFAG